MKVQPVMLDKFRIPDPSTAERVMKVCLLVSLSLGILVIVLALVFHRRPLDVGGSIIGMVALQWFTYLLVKGKRTSNRERD